MVFDFIFLYSIFLVFIFYFTSSFSILLIVENICISKPRLFNIVCHSVAVDIFKNCSSLKDILIIYKSLRYKLFF